jgi:hypothetical protein
LVLGCEWNSRRASSFAAIPTIIHARDVFPARARFVKKLYVIRGKKLTYVITQSEQTQSLHHLKLCKSLSCHVDNYTPRRCSIILNSLGFKAIIEVVTREIEGEG